MTDAELILAIQAGDETALESLYTRYLPAVWRYAYAHLAGNVNAAEDVVSETFLAAVRQVAGLVPDAGSLGGWLIGIARHKVMDHRRRNVRMTVVAEPENTPSAPADRTDPGEALEAGETRACIASIMEHLDHEERLALEWKHVDGLAVREIALRLGRTEKAVEAILYRARSSFRAAYERAQRAER